MANTAVTIAANRVSPLSEQEFASIGMNKKFVITASDIAFGTGTEDTVTMTLGATPAQWYIDKALVQINTAFSGSTGTFVMIVGTTSSTAALISSTSVKTVATLNQVSTVPVLTNTKGTASVNLVATFTNGTAGSPSAFTAGQLTIYLNVQDATELP